MAAEARRRGAGHVRQLTILGDGAHWIWNLASKHFPEATQIVDLYHAREHLHDLGKLLAFMLGDQHATWVAERSGELDDGDIAALLSAARAFPLTGTKAEELDTALGYFETNAPRMRYKHFRSLRPVRRLRRRGGRLQGGHRAAPQTLRHALVLATARPASSPCAASKPAAAGTKSGSSRPTGPERPDRHLTTTRTQTIQARPGYRSVTYILVLHPRSPRPPPECQWVPLSLDRGRFSDGKGLGHLRTKGPGRAAAG